MIIWFIILIVNGIDGFPDGAPRTTCITLFPQHSGLVPETAPLPYAIHAELYNRKVTVRISSPVGDVFKGFILQARSATDPSKFINGEFTASQFSKAINCIDGDKSTLTHVNRTQKTEIITEWTPRRQLNEEVIFRATIVKQFDKFWTNVDSNPVKLMSDTQSLNNQAMYEKCFKEEGCVGLPDGCVEQQVCEVLLRYSKTNDSIIFHLQGRHLEGVSANYIAMAWSEDPIMGEDSVTECIREGTNVKARESWNEGKSNTRTKNLHSYMGTFVDGLTTCLWKTPLITEANGRTYNFPEKNYYILLATGDVTEGRLKYHHNRISSSEALRLTDFKEKERVIEPEVEDTSPDTEVQPPSSVTPQPETTDSTSQKEESFIYSNETITKSNSSSLSGTFLFLFAILLFTCKKIINDMF